MCFVFYLFIVDKKKKQIEIITHLYTHKNL